jgi:prefoldin subunit 5
MKIKRFFESEQVDISEDRISEILKELGDFITNIEDKSKTIESLGAELSNYKNNSKEINHIDKSISELQITKNDLDNCILKLENVVDNLNSYKEKLNFSNTI